MKEFVTMSVNNVINATPHHTNCMHMLAHIQVHKFQNQKTTINLMNYFHYPTRKIGIKLLYGQKQVAHFIKNVGNMVLIL